MAKRIDCQCPTESCTPADSSFFFGFHDLCPWSPDNTHIAMLRYSSEIQRIPNGVDEAAICIWDPRSDGIRSVASTKAWNFQQGARLRWLSDGSLLFNVIEGGEARARVITDQAKVVKELPMAVGALSPDESLAISPSFGRLGRYWPAYGYSGAQAPGLDDPCPRDDGLWAIDVERQQKDLLLSIFDVASYGTGQIPVGPHFVTHPHFNRSGTRLAFMQRFFSADGGLFSRLFVCHPDGSELRLIASEKVSHFDWIDDDTIIIWARFMPAGIAKLRSRGVLNFPFVKPLVRIARAVRGPIKNSVLSEHYYQIPVEDPTQRKVIASDVLTADGHPMLHPSRPIMVSDTYPDENGMLNLFLYDFSKDTRIDIARFADGVTTKDSDLKCDLHPRWDRAGERVAIDICERGVRRLAIVDARPALALLAG